MSNHSDEAGWVMPLPTKVTSADLLPDEHDEDEPHHPTEHAAGPSRVHNFCLSARACFGKFSHGLAAASRPPWP